MHSVLDCLHAQVRRNPWAARFISFNRILLAVGFIPPGMAKVLGGRFTQIPIDDPVGFFFEAFYRAHGWYRLVGVAQVAAGLLLLLPRTAHLGALLFLPIITNIVAITWSIDFAGTRYITLLMLASTTLLVLWDYDRWKGLWPHQLGGGLQGTARDVGLTSALFAAGGVGLSLLVVMLSLGGKQWADLPRLAGTFGGMGAMFGLAVGLHFRAMPASDTGTAPGVQSINCRDK
ncbi:DoxX family membrane protein [Myxococcus xanthus]|uniref:DoxX family membrane protein n=1 Tax=Myxococcus xanthus TaxID=34 RepID=UPI0019175F15|nr:DoxX family membrane protein [Myxococcus xanthus]QQR43999.1 DoxX family membrane protein [Myxococcus xanthus]